MGLFDFLKFKKGSDRPRPYHYHFAHSYLPSILFKSCEGTIDWLTSEKGDEHLKVRWDMQMMFHQFQAGDYFEPEGLRREVSTQQNDRPLILIRFPKPRYIGEAFSALILSFPDGRYRYFTIELTLGGKAILGEWAGTGCHINHGILSGHIINAAIDHIYSLYNESLGSSKE